MHRPEGERLRFGASKTILSAETSREFYLHLMRFCNDSRIFETDDQESFGVIRQISHASNISRLGGELSIVHFSQGGVSMAKCEAIIETQDITILRGPSPIPIDIC